MAGPMTMLAPETSTAPMEVGDLDNRGIESVIVAAPDIQGRLFGKRMSTASFEKKLKAGGIQVCTCALSWDVEQDLAAQLDYAGFHTGWHDFRLVPELATLRPLGWLDDAAICFADVIEDDVPEPVQVAPRNILKRQIERLAELGFSGYVGGELEFFLYKPGYDEARRGGYRNLQPTTLSHVDYLIQPGNGMEWYFRELRRGLERSGIAVELSQAEWGLGQWEMNLEYDEALTTADANTLFKMAVKDISARHDMAATFMARPSTEEIGSSGHIHVSLQDESRRGPFYDADGANCLSDVFKYAMGGILEHLSDLMLWYAPTVNSYRRVEAEGLVAGAGATWGIDNRTASCRALGDSPESLRIEFRLPGADANPYLAYAGLYASVTDGLETKPDPGPPRSGDVIKQERPPLPSDLAKASEAFRASEFARGAFGDLVVDHYATLADFEWAKFTNVVTEWEIDRYFEPT